MLIQTRKPSPRENNGEAGSSQKKVQCRGHVFLGENSNLSTTGILG